MTPTDPSWWSTLPTPLSFVGGCLALGIWLVRELTKLIAEHHADQGKKIDELTAQVADLNAQTKQLRKQSAAAERAAFDARVRLTEEAQGKQMDLIRANARLVQILAAHGIDPESETP